MPYNGAGVFSIVNTFVPGTTIFSSAVNANYTDIATGMSSAVLKDGTQTITANIPFAGFKPTTIGAATANGNALRYQQLFPAPGAAIYGGHLTAAVASNALTIAVKYLDGSDPTASAPVHFAFRNATASTGTFTEIDASAALSLTISSGSTMGTSNSVPFRLWIVIFNDGGTLRLGAVNCLSSLSIMALRDDLLLSSTAEGGAGAADSAQVIYTGTAVAAKACRILGYFEWASGLATAGTWSAVPTTIQLHDPGVALPGQVIQTVISETGASSSGTTLIPHDNTIPQSGEGDQYFSQAITPRSAANLLEIEHLGFYSSTVGGYMATALFQDATANALRASVEYNGTGAAQVSHFWIHRMLAATAAATTFKVRAGGSSAGTLRINGDGGAQTYNGVEFSSLTIREVMA